MVVFTVVVVGFLMTMAVRAHHTQVTTGVEGLVNKRGVAREVLDPRGRVFVHGEIWNATSDGGAAIAPGTEIRVVAVDGMNLTVRPEDEKTDTVREVRL